MSIPDERDAWDCEFGTPRCGAIPVVRIARATPPDRAGVGGSHSEQGTGYLPAGHPHTRGWLAPTRARLRGDGCWWFHTLPPPPPFDPAARLHSHATQRA